VTHETRSFFTTTLHGVMYMYLLNRHQNKLQMQLFLCKVPGQICVTLPQ